MFRTDDDLRAALMEIIPKCLELRDDGRYYPTEAGCIRLQEWLGEHGVAAHVEITDSERFDIQFTETGDGA